MTLIAESTTDTPAEIADALGVEPPAEETSAAGAEGEARVEAQAQETREETPVVERDQRTGRFAGKAASTKPSSGRAEKRIGKLVAKAGEAEAENAVLRTRLSALERELETARSGKQPEGKRAAEVETTEQKPTAKPVEEEKKPVVAKPADTEPVIDRDKIEIPKAEKDTIVAKYAAEREKLGAKPKLEQFDHDVEAWQDAREEYSAKRARIDAREEHELQTAHQREVDRVTLITRQTHLDRKKAVEVFKERQATFKKDHADFDQVVTDDVKASPTMITRIVRSPVGPALQYYLGQHRDEAARIFAMRPDEQLDALFEIEVELRKDAKNVSGKRAAGDEGETTTRSETRTTRRLSRAPDPPETELGSGNSVREVDLEKMTGAEYTRYRNRQEGLEGPNAARRH